MPQSALTPPHRPRVPSRVAVDPSVQPAGCEAPVTAVRIDRLQLHGYADERGATDPYPTKSNKIAPIPRHANRFRAIVVKIGWLNLPLVARDSPVRLGATWSKCDSEGEKEDQPP